jgi:anti-sigma factor RsiW
VGHLPQDLLSAFADDELSAAEAESARQHLSGCATCRAELAEYARFDAALSAPPALSCEAARPLVSAQIDGELDVHETLAAAAHLTACQHCRDARQAWLAADGALRRLPTGMPSPRVDMAIRALGQRGGAARRPARDWRRVVTAPLLAGGLAAAGFSAFAALSGGGGRLGAVPDGQIRVVPGLGQVALTGPLAVQEVLNTKTNTLYALRPATNTVAALDPFSKLQRASIALTAKPITLAVNEDANLVYVLDVQRRLVEIDGASNTVVATKDNVVDGTPTAIQYDPNKKQIVIGAAASSATAAPTRAPAATAAATASPGVVVVLDSRTKTQIDTRVVDAVPQILVLDDSGSRALLVSNDATSIVDTATYQLSLKLPGGVAGAFSTNGPIGIISSANGGTRLSFYGNGAPTPIDLEGSPLAMTAMPEGGFGVLINANGKGRVYVVDASGKVTDRIDIGAIAPALSYDARSRRFAVIGADVTYAALPSASASAAPTVAAGSPRPSVTASPSAKPSASESAAPTTTPSTAPVVTIPLPTPSGKALPVPAYATVAWTGTYRLDLPFGKRVAIAAIDPGKQRIWFVDQNRTLNSMSTTSYASFPVAQLPGGANIDALVVGTSHVYAIDRAGIQLYDLALSTEIVTPQSLGMLRGSSSFALTPDDRLWFGRTGSPQLFGYDPRTRRVSVVDTTASSISAVASDASGRVWFAGVDRLGSYDPRTQQLIEYKNLPAHGSPNALTIDSSGQAWIATDSGELLAIANGKLTLSARTDRPLVGFTFGPDGGVWSIGPGAFGMAYGPVDGSRTRETVPSAVNALFFDGSGRAWMVDRTLGVFYASVFGQ